MTLARAATGVVTATDLRCCEDVGYEGLAPGLAAALGVPTVPAGPVGPVATTPGGWAAVPEFALPQMALWGVGGEALSAENVRVVRRPHRLADAEGIALVQVTMVPDPVESGRFSADLLVQDQARTVAHVALRLAAVRLGLTRRMLDLAAQHLAERLSGDVPLLRLQLPQAAIAESAAAIELARDTLAAVGSADADPNPAVLADLHTRISAVDWQVLTLFGASGYVADHPVRCLYVAEILRNLLVPGPSVAGRDDRRR